MIKINKKYQEGFNDGYFKAIEIIWRHMFPLTKEEIELYM